MADPAAKIAADLMALAGHGGLPLARSFADLGGGGDALTRTPAGTGSVSKRTPKPLVVLDADPDAFHEHVDEGGHALAPLPFPAKPHPDHPVRRTCHSAQRAVLTHTRAPFCSWASGLVHAGGCVGSVGEIPP